MVCWPFKFFSPCLFGVWFLLRGPPGGRGASSRRLCFWRHEQDDMRGSCSCVFVMLTCFVFSTRLRGGHCPLPRRLSEFKLALLRLCFELPAFLKAWHPLDILSIFFCFSWPNGCFFFLSGWVGFPLPRFLPSPLFLLAFFFLLLGGLAPLAAFSRCFPRASWVGWGAFSGFFLRFLAISCILHLSLLGLS